MDIEMKSGAVPAELVELARRIAERRGYRVLIGGLQPADDYEVDGKLQSGLRSKLLAEQQEFREALASGKERIWWLSEAADRLYYAACLDVVAPVPGKPLYHYVMELVALHQYGIVQWEAEAAALAKYRLRAEQPYNKERETPEERAARDARENAAIEEALRQAEWPGFPLSEIASKYGISQATLHSAADRGEITARRGRGTTLVLLDERTWGYLLQHAKRKQIQKKKGEKNV